MYGINPVSLLTSVIRTAFNVVLKKKIHMDAKIYTIIPDKSIFFFYFFQAAYYFCNLPKGVSKSEILNNYFLTNDIKMFKIIGIKYAKHFNLNITLNLFLND